MALRIVNQFGESVAAAVHEAFPDALMFPVTADGPDPGLTADVLYGGWGDWSMIGKWAELVPWVQLAGTGVDRVPGELFDGRVVTCARGASAVPISEFVLAAMLAFEKRIPEVWVKAPPEHWNFASLGTLDGRTLGLVGLGGIGTAVAERALAFGMRVLAVRRTASPSPVEGVEVVGSLGEMLAEVDHLVLAAPATARTRGLIDAAALALLKPGAHLVNIARGALLDQDALRAALDDGRVALATLDTVHPEPLPEGHWLYEHPKVRVSPHVSWASPRGGEAATRMFVENLRRRVAGEPLHGIVDPEEGY